MTELGVGLTADSSLVTDSLEFVREEFLARQKTTAQSFLTACYVNGVELWQGQRQKVAQRIEEAGGIKKIKAGRGSYNHVKCNDGVVISLSSILKAEAVPLPLPEGTPTFDLLETTQDANLQLSFGGNIEVNAMGAFNTRYDLDTHDFIRPRDIEHILFGDYRPTQVGLTEMVVTRSSVNDNLAASGHRYQVMGRLWGAKLREEFAPDPYENPEAYAAWRAEKPLPRLDITFQATSQPVRSRYEQHEPEFRAHDGLQTFYGDSVMGVSFTLEAAQKMIRMGGLLNMLWRLDHGMDMPVPADSTFAPVPKALTA